MLPEVPATALIDNVRFDPLQSLYVVARFVLNEGGEIDVGELPPKLYEHIIVVSFEPDLAAKIESENSMVTIPEELPRLPLLLLA